MFRSPGFKFLNCQTDIRFVSFLLTLKDITHYTFKQFCSAEVGQVGLEPTRDIISHALKACAYTDSATGPSRLTGYILPNRQQNLIFSKFAI